MQVGNRNREDDRASKAIDKTANPPAARPHTRPASRQGARPGQKDRPRNTRATQDNLEGGTPQSTSALYGPPLPLGWGADHDSTTTQDVVERGVCHSGRPDSTTNQDVVEE